MINQLFRQINLFRKYFLNSRVASSLEVQNDFAMYLEPVDVQAYTESLKKSLLFSKVLNEVAYKGRHYPIVQLDRVGKNATKRLLIFAGVHGNEFAAALAIQDLVTDIQNQHSKYNDWNIRIVAPLNPVGLAFASRYNEDGYDINRDFKLFRTVGAQVQRDTINDFQPDILVSLHEGPHEGFFMFSEGKLPRELKNALVERLQNAQIPLANRSFLHLKLRSGIWEKPPIVFLLQRLFGIHTLGSFTHRRKIPTLTTESSWPSNDVAARKKPHLQVITAIVESGEFL